MTMYYLGIDIGSLSCDAVLIDDAEKVLASAVVPTGARNVEAIAAVRQAVLNRAGISSERVTATISTGYGRERVSARTAAVTEITCHARGIEALSGGLQREWRLDRKRFDEYLVVMIRRGLGVDQMRRAIPPRVRPTILFAEFLEATARPALAEEALAYALTLARTEEGVRAADFRRIQKFYTNRRRDEDAGVVV